MGAVLVLLLLAGLLALNVVVMMRSDREIERRMDRARRMRGDRAGLYGGGVYTDGGGSDGGGYDYGGGDFGGGDFGGGGGDGGGGGE